MCLFPPMSAVVGRFRVEEKLGEDAFGELHRAVAIEGGSDAIVRIVRAEGGAARRDRLIREAKRAARLQHEGLAKVLEVGQTDDGRMFVAVERIDGERLSDRLRGGEPLPEREAATIAAQIARALAPAHDAGVVHRNLRPSLIALAGEGEATRVKVEALATPRSSSESGADDPELAYAAPEQRRGDSVGRRADVYSIGAMLQAMLTGKPPAPVSLEASNASEVPASAAAADASEAPDASEALDAAAIEGALGDVVRRCLAEDPRERFLDTIALGAALRMAMESTTPRVSSRPPPSKRSSPPPASPPAPAAASVRPAAPGSASAGVAAAGVTSTSERPPPSSRGQTPRPASVRPPSAPELAAAARPPAAPPPRPLGRPLTARPRWEETLIDLSEGPLPRVAVTVVVAFVIVRILTSGPVPFVIAIAAGVAAYATKYWRGTRGDR